MPNQNTGIPVAHSFLNDIQPGLQSLQNQLPRWLNPHYDQYLGLKEQLAKDPSIAQKLIDMGPEQVAKIYGKQALKLYDSTGAKSSKQGLEELIRERMKGQDPLFIDQIVANATGTQTKKQNTKEDLGIKRDQLGNVIAEQTVEGNTGQLSDAARARQADIAGNAAGEIVTSTRPNAIRNMYQAVKTGQITAQEWNAMSGIKKYKDAYDNGQQDFWAQKRNEIDLQQLALSRTAADPNRQTSQYLQNRVAAVAADIGEEHGIDPKSIIPLMQSKTLYDAALTDKKNPQHLVAKAIENRRERAGEKDYRTALGMVAKLTSTDRMLVTSKDPRISDDMRQASVDRINQVNAAQLSEFTKDVPVYRYDSDKSGRKAWGLLAGDKKFYMDVGTDMANITPKAGDTETNDLPPGTTATQINADADSALKQPGADKDGINKERARLLGLVGKKGKK